MLRVDILIGFPGSGKSTWAHKEVLRWRKKKRCAVIINKDAFRQMIAGEYRYDKNTEPLIGTMSFLSFMAAASSRSVGKVIIDETNITAKKRRYLLWSIARVYTKVHANIYVRYVWFKEADILKLMHNRMKNSRGVRRAKWFDVISNMKRSFEKPTMAENCGTGLGIKPRIVKTYK